jgi:glutathione S-transferase
MSINEVVLHGFPRSTYVSVARLVLQAKGVPYRFHDIEHEIGQPAYLERHPFGRTPVLQHGDFTVYETSAIASYVDEAFDGPPLQPADAQGRARCQQWISNLNSYFYPYAIYRIVHERVVFPDLGIAGDDAIVAEAVPKVAQALAVLERELQGQRCIVGEHPTLADYFMLPTISALGLTDEGKGLLARWPAINAWGARMAARPEVMAFRALLPPRAPIEHARRWVLDHRPAVARRSA